MHRSALLRVPLHIAGALLLAGALCVPLFAAGERDASRPENVEAALRRLCEELEVGPGDNVAEIGCGGGSDSMTFAEIVGPGGKVFAEEIEAGKVEKVLEKTTEHDLSQVVPVLGASGDPRLPDGTFDLIYMRRVFHHFARPRDMLRAIWDDLRPGGHLVIVDRHRGVLRDPVPLETRESEHNWTGETAVVRLGRESGFLFVDSPNDLWHKDGSFVVIFRRPVEGERVEGDPEAAAPWEKGWISTAIARTSLAGRSVAVIALDRGRAVVGPLGAAVGPDGRLLDVVLDEWRITEDEVPPVEAGPPPQVVRCEDGRIAWPEGVEPEGAVFADSYHRLWDPEPFLASLRERLPADGRVVVIDRQGPSGEPRRLAGHRRRADPRRVIEEFREAGFEFLDDDVPPDPGRFMLWFRVPVPARGESTGQVGKNF